MTNGIARPAVVRVQIPGRVGAPGEATPEFREGVVQVAEARTVVEDAVVQTGEARDDAVQAAADAAASAAEAASYTDEQVAQLTAGLAAAMATIDVLSPPTTDFSRPAMAGSPLFLLLGV